MKTNYTTEVKKALKDGNPVLALESTIISSGMPYPQNIDFHKKAEQVCYDCGVVPATIAIIKGVVCVGLSGDQAEYIATIGRKNFKKRNWCVRTKTAIGGDYC